MCISVNMFNRSKSSVPWGGVLMCIGVNEEKKTVLHFTLKSILKRLVVHLRNTGFRISYTAVPTGESQHATINHFQLVDVTSPYKRFTKSHSAQLLCKMLWYSQVAHKQPHKYSCGDVTSHQLAAEELNLALISLKCPVAGGWRLQRFSDANTGYILLTSQTGCFCMSIRKQF